MGHSVDTSRVKNGNHMTILEVIDECDLSCSTCIADSTPGSGNIRRRQDLVARVTRLVQRTGQVELLMVSGGEPTLHHEILDILRDLCVLANQVMLITNGVRIAQDESFSAELAKLGSNFQVYLQFDSLNPKALISLRGKDYSDVRQRALKNLRMHNVPVTLVCIVKRGINDKEVGEIVRFACDFPNVRGVTFQPIKSSGRHADFNYDRDSITLSEVRQQLIHDLCLTESALEPHPVNPERICIGYFDRRTWPVVSLTDLALAQGRANNSQGHTRTPLYLADDTTRLIFGGMHPLRITIISFLDRFDFTYGSSKQGGVVFFTDDERLVTFDQRFLFGLNGNPTPQPKELAMTTETSYCVVLTTTSNEEQAEDLAKKILGQKLAACVQIQQIKSYYMWKGEVCNDPECLLFIKARKAQFQELEDFICKNHTYETPEIVQIPITAGFSGYLHWIDEVTGA